MNSIFRWAYAASLASAVPLLRPPAVSAQGEESTIVLL